MRRDRRTNKGINILDAPCVRSDLCCPPINRLDQKGLWSKTTPILILNGEHMRFRLTYEGKLLPNGYSAHKHEIRKQFHPQLRRLWEQTKSLGEMRDPVRDLVMVNRRPDRSRVEGLAERFSRNGYQFVPLVTRDLNVSYCGLEILFLRPDSPGTILKSGY